MAHHVPAVLPPIVLPMPKLDRLRWRPRRRADASDAAGEAEAPGDIDDLQPLAAQQEASRAKPAGPPATPLRPALSGGLTARTLTDDTLRTLLGVQEGLSGQEGPSRQEGLLDKPA